MYRIERGIDALTAHQASIAAAELPEDYAIEETAQTSAVAAWYAAKFAALQALFEATGQWPEFGALIYVKDER